MNGGVAVLLRCGAVPRLLLPSLRSLEQQTASGSDVLVLLDPTTPAAADEWIDAIAGKRGVPVVRFEGPSPGRGLNKALDVTSTEIVLILEAGDELERDAIARIQGMTGLAMAGFSLVAMRLLGPGPTSRVLGPGSPTAFEIAANPETAQTSTIFHRRTLEAVKGFDETLPGLEVADAAIRIARTGRSGLSLQDPIVRRHAEAPGRWRSESQVVALEISEAFLRRHLDLLASDPVAVLRAREEAVRELGARYWNVRNTRQARLTEIAELRDTSTRLLADCSEATFDFGWLQRTTPWSRNWGYDRGVPIDRYYIERFLEAQASDIQGCVLEIQEPDYTRRFGGDRVTRSDVLDLEASNPRATVIADLRDAPNIPDATYDCIVITQTLHVVDDMRSVVEECARILKPGGVLLATLPSASRVCLEYGRDGDFWRVTAAGARRLFEQAFAPEQIQVGAHGNVLATSAFQYGLGLSELNPADLEADDAFNPTLVTVRARKGSSLAPALFRATAAPADQRGVVLLYHRVADPRSDVHGLCVSPSAFAQQMDYVAEHCTPVSLEELAEAARNGHIPPRAVAVTFDDGYFDTFATATPLLYGRRIPATVFATTAALEQETAFRYWWDVLEWALLVAPLDVARVQLPEGERSFVLSTAAERLAAHQAIHALLVPLDASLRDHAIQSLLDGREPDGTRVQRRMSLSELRALAAVPGMTVGAHGHDHLALSAHVTQVQRSEISTSRRVLESVLGRPVRTFAYPFGACSDETPGLVAEAQLGLAVTCDDGAVRPGADPFRLARLAVGGETTQAFAARLSRTFIRSAAAH